MSEQRPPLSAVAERPAGDRLETWGEIAAYLGKEIRTVQRWEKSMGLPVRRLAAGADKQSRVFALKSELDAWWREHEVLRNAQEISEESSASNTSVVAERPQPGPFAFVRLRPVQYVLVVLITILLTVTGV